MGKGNTVKQMEEADDCRRASTWEQRETGKSTKGWEKAAGVSEDQGYIRVLRRKEEEERGNTISQKNTEGQRSICRRYV